MILAYSMMSLTNTVLAEPECSTQVINIKQATGHDPKPVNIASDSHNRTPKIHLITILQ